MRAPKYWKGPKREDLESLPPFLKMKQAMWISSMSRNTIKRKIENDEIEAVKINDRGEVRVVTESLLKFLGVDQGTEIKAVDMLRSL